MAGLVTEPFNAPSKSTEGGSAFGGTGTPSYLHELSTPGGDKPPPLHEFLDRDFQRPSKTGALSDTVTQDLIDNVNLIVLHPSLPRAEINSSPSRILTGVVLTPAT